MKKRVYSLILVFLMIFLVPFILAEGVDEGIKKLTHYAEEYESGNIDYVKLMVYTASVRESLNEEMGVVSMEQGGLLKQDQIKRILGEPQEETKWVWVEGEEKERKVLNPVPVWRKIVFDGKKITIRLEAYPSIFVKGKDFDMDSDFEEEVIIYRLHFQMEFKKPEEQLNLESKIEVIKSLAETANSNPSKENMNALAKESVNVERTFEDTFRQGGGECVDLMNSIFGSENKRGTQKQVVEEISFYEGDNFEAIMRLEMCDDCEWKGIHMNMWIEGRGPGFHHPETKGNEGDSKGKYKGLDFDGFKGEIKGILSEIKSSLEQGDYGQAISNSNRLQRVNEAWNEQSNNEVWDKVKKDSEQKMVEMELKKKNNQGEDGDGGSQMDPYFWIEEDKRQREKVKQIQDVNYEARKRFYGELFSGYDKKEFYFESEEWEMRLVEEFRASGEEICSNNQDDNNNGQKDCEEAQCGGKFCGKEVVVVGDGNDSRKQEVDLYCISSVCQQKEEIVVSQDPICGNHICEAGENIPPSGGVVIVEAEEEEVVETAPVVEDTVSSAASITGNVVAESEGVTTELEVPETSPVEETETSSDSSVSSSTSQSFYCPQDCVQCPVYEAVSCEGKLMFSGTDEGGCQLPPVCVEDKACFSDNDCEFRCGKGECIFEDDSGEGVCELVELGECSEAECVDGEEKVKNCDSGEQLIVGFCVDGLWEETGLNCEGGEIPEGLGCTSCGNDCITKEQSMVVDCSLPTIKFDCVEHNDECVVVEEESLDCAKCGDGCITKEASMVADCAEPGDDFGCVENNGGCERIEFVVEHEDDEVEGVVVEEEIFDDECVTVSDCGGMHDVCSNGRCVAIPESFEEEEEEIIIEVVEEDNNVEELEQLIEEEFAEEVEEEESNEADVSGGVILGLFDFFRGLGDGGITGKVTGFDVSEDGDDTTPEPDNSGSDDGSSGSDEGGSDDDVDSDPEDDSSDGSGSDDGFDGDSDEGSDQQPSDEGENDWEGEDPGPGPEPDNDCDDKWKACGGSCPPCDYDQGSRNDGDHDYEDDNERRKHEEERNEWNEEDKKERAGNCQRDCKRTCEDRVIRPYVESCVYGENGRDMCEGEDCIKDCKKEALKELDLGACTSECVGYCTEGKWEDFERQFKDEEKEMHKEEKGVFSAWGSCRKDQGKTNGNIHFGGWGEPFEDVERYKQKYYQREGDWCKWELQNSIKQRKEIEKGFNQEFAKWFFEDYLANAAEEWQEHMSGLYEMYWTSVETSRRMAENMQCLGKNDISSVYEPQLINFQYETEYGSVEYWEELKEVDVFGKGGEKVKIVSPYMKVWIYPTKEFIKFEMQKSMEEHEFPGDSEEKMRHRNEGFPKKEVLEALRNDGDFMDLINDITETNGGNSRAVMQIIDYEGEEEVVFNVLTEINAEDLVKMEAMPIEEVGEYDTMIKIDFEKVYDLVSFSMEKMDGARIESPPWDHKKQPIQGVKDFANGIRMYFKAKGIVNSAKVTPEENEDLAKDFMIQFMQISGEKEDEREGPPEGFEDLTDEEKEMVKEEFGEEGDNKYKRVEGEEDGGFFGFFGGDDDDDEFDDEPRDVRDGPGESIEDMMTPEEYEKFKSLPENERQRIVKEMKDGFRKEPGVDYTREGQGPGEHRGGGPGFDPNRDVPNPDGPGVSPGGPGDNRGRS
jgi:hypothetical protein